MAKILVIEDDAQFRQMLKQMLERNGHTVFTATNGNEGLDYFRRFTVDLVITDIMMPEKDGIDTIMDLKKESPDVRILAISGGRRALSPKFNLDSATLLGVEATLTKPFELKQFLGTVDRLLAA